MTTEHFGSAVRRWRPRSRVAVARRRRHEARATWLRWCVSLLVAFIPWRAASAADYEFSIYPSSSPEPTKLQDTADMKTGLDAAPWLAGFIDKIRAHRPPVYRIDQVALIHGDGSTSYLLINWIGDTMWGRAHLEFHKVVYLGNGKRRIYYLRRYEEGGGIEIMPPTGIRLVPGAAPIVLLRIWSGGLWIMNYGMRLLQMKRNTVDITPKWVDRIVDLADIDGDGTYELVTMDPGWASAFSGRSEAGPHVPVVLRVENGDFVPACRKYAPVYKRWIDGYLRDADDTRNSPPLRAEAYSYAELAYAQIGALDDARRIFDKLMSFVANHAKDMPDGSDPKYIKAARDEFLDVIERAKRYANLPCVVSAAFVSDDPKYRERRRRFRMEKD